jgi:type IV pilus assembly protein PilC
MPEHELLAFTRQLRVMLQAGLPLLAGLDLMARAHPPKATQVLLGKLRRQIMAGRALHEALRSVAHIPTHYVQTVAAGEASGSLPNVLQRLAEQLESRHMLRRQLRSAFTYPVIVLLIAVAVVGVMMVWVIPAFESMFASLGGQLPAATRWVLTLSHAVSTGWPTGLGCMGLAFMAAMGIWRHPSGRLRALDGLWRLPGWGALHRLSCQARWTRNLATLSAAGLPLTDALTHLAGTSGHPRFDAATRQIRRRLVQGQSLSRALAPFGPQRPRPREPELFSGMMLQMTHIGEESGSLDVLLERAAQQLEHEVSQRVGALARLVEPGLMVVLGGVVGGLVIALYLPLFQLGQIL